MAWYNVAITVTRYEHIASQIIGNSTDGQQLFPVNVNGNIKGK